LSELQVIKKHFDGYDKWEKFLRSYATQKQLNDSWLKFGLWRWRKVPNELVKILNDYDLDKTPETKLRPDHFETQTEPSKIQEDIGEESEIYTIGNYRFISLGGFEDCKGSLSLEGVFSFAFDFERISKLLNILGVVTIDENLDSFSLSSNINMFKNGTLSIQGEDKTKIDKNLENIHKIIVRSKDCVKCGICTSRCPTNALFIDNELNLDPSKCNHCRKCLGPCTVIDFNRDVSIEF
jgi:phosphoadenosine phosphosulfate reductase